ncbi:MAG: hypothetical protein HDT05_02780 [Bacteroidales bacterium]|nr:hypothetical protein [Bacteroidales bacterium]
MWQVFKIVNLFYLLVSSYAWFSFLLPANYIPLGVSAVMLILFVVSNFKMTFTPRFMLILAMISIYAIYTTLNLDIFAGLLTFFSYLPAALIFTLDKEYQNDLLLSVSKWLSIILGISLGVFFLGKVVPLPHTSFVVPNNDFYVPFENYFFYLNNPGFEAEDAGIFRFSAIFLEPGHLSMICALMLFANRYQFKDRRWLWIPLLCVLISFSLTGYVVLVLSLFLLKIRNVWSMIATVIVVGGAWLFVTEIWNEGNNPANILIVQRLEPDKEKGIKGNNRVFKKTDSFYRQCVKDGRIWNGVGLKEMGDRIRGAGFKIFMLRYGAISTIFCGLIYLLLIDPKANKRYAYSFLFIVVLLFLQRAYPTWYSWLFFYTVGIGVMRNEPFFTPYQLRKIQEKEARKRLHEHESTNRMRVQNG